MTHFERIISELETMKHRLNMFIQPQTPEILQCYLNGLGRGVMLSFTSLIFDDYVNARRASNKQRGWKLRSKSPLYEMREKGISEDEIVQELLEIEIQMWKILEYWEKER